ncbi:MAG: hypothetical protein JWR83_1037 [Aeromicrobium sp.]|nr:hypothetical protein [Aeromicrobium sp.]
MTVINFRTDSAAERALAEPTADGTNASEAIRQALTDAVRMKRREKMRRESLEIMNDPAEVAERLGPLVGHLSRGRARRHQ